MINPKTIKYYAVVSTKNSRGQVVNTFPVVTSHFQASIKPISLSEVQSLGWSVTDMSSNTKFMAYPKGQTIAVLNRIVDADGNWYEIRSVNQWSHFPQALLIPVQGESAPVSVDGIYITPSILSIAVLDSPVTLTKTFIPAIPSNTSVVWSSSSPSYATVSQLGVVTPVTAGSTAITVTSVDGGFSATCQVTVTP